MAGPTPCFPVYSQLTISQVSSEFPSYVDGSGANPDLLPALYHTDPVCRLFNYWYCPHWSYSYWFPPDSTGAVTADDWPLYGAQAKPTLYWLPEQTQFFRGSTLPGGEATATRTDLISAPLLHGQLATFLLSMWGQQTSFWGVSRFVAQNRKPVASYTFDSSTSSRWSFAGATAAFGGSIVLTPSALTVVATLKASDWAAPGLLMQLMDALTINWSGASIASVSVALVGADTASHVIATVPGTYSWRQAKDAIKYAGSWAQDFGVGFDGSDQATDFDANGISAATDAAVETLYAFELLATGTFKSLVFTFILSGTGSTITLNYPSFTTRQDAPGAVLAETGQYQAAIWQNGPGVRFGQWTFWDPTGGGSWVGPTPNIDLLGAGWSVLDYLGTRRLALDAIAPDSGIDAEIASLYDAVEGQTRALVAIGTTAFMCKTPAGLTGVLINSQSESPPMCQFPQHDRDVSLQPVTASWCQKTWSHAQEHRYLICAGPTGANLQDSGGTIWTSLSSIAVGGWALFWHAHALTNSEGPNYWIVNPVQHYTHNVTPWHGYFLDPYRTPGGGVGYDVSTGLRHVRVWHDATTGHLFLSTAGNVIPQTWTTVDTGLLAKWGRPRFQDCGSAWPIGLFYGDGTTCYFVQTPDEGSTFGTVINMASGTFGDFEEGANGIRWFFKVLSSDGGVTYDIWSKVLDAQLNVIQAWTITNITGIDNEPIACRESPNFDASWKIGLLYSLAGAPNVKFSPDGLTFT